jgi:GNAT superfamily N-acetyltransferase
MDTTFLIRPAVASDVATVVALYADDDLGQFRESPQPEVSARYTDAFAAIARDPNHQLVVGVIEDDIVATLLLSFLPGLSRNGAWRAQIESMRVARPWRGQGLGRILLDWAVVRARDRGCDLVQLTSDRQRPAAHRFYEAAGFEASHVGFKLKL